MRQFRHQVTCSIHQKSLKGRSRIFLNQFSFSLRSCVNEAGGYSCDCEGTGYSGVYCTVDVDECDGTLGEIRCKNGGKFH